MIKIVYRRIKTIKGNDYIYEQCCNRDENGKVQTKHVRYIGRVGSVNGGGLGTTQEIKSPLIKKSVDYFGTTNNPLETGYILPDGQGLDFSGRNNAQGYKNKKPTGQDYLKNQRSIDHRDVNGLTKADYTEAITEFVNKTNAVRVSFFQGQVNISIEKSNKLTNAQKSTLMRYKKQVGANSIYYDLYDGKGNIKKSGDIKNISEVEKIEIV